jgi:hypothetical protein
MSNPRTFNLQTLPNDDGHTAADASVILRVLVGSRAYGLAREDSDADLRGVYIPSAAAHWSLTKPPEQFESDEEQTVIWELEKFLALALKGNPAILETLWSPVVLFASDLGRELLALRTRVLSKAVYRSFLGYAETQFVGMSRAMDRTGSVKWRHAMHMIRLLIAGEGLVRTGDLVLDATPHRERLLRVRDGIEPWSAILAWKNELSARLDLSFQSTTLPDSPDTAAANAFLVRARHAMAHREQHHA